jgi:ATP-dependent protease ClpP protease subunit
MPEVNRKAPDETHTQSVIFYKADDWTVSSSRSWLKSHDYYTDGLDENDTQIRWRQYDPADKFEYRTKKIKHEGKPISLLIGYLKSQGKENAMTKQGIFMRKKEDDDKTCVIDIIGVIGWEVWYPAMMDMLKGISDSVENVIFDIYSPGGDVWEGNAIANYIGQMKQNTVARVQVAASMATIIAVACKKREIAANGRWLIHNPWTQLAGDADALEKRAKELRDCEAEAAEFYSKRSGQPVEKIIDLMDEERWLTPKETLELGFVQAINDPFDQADFAAVKDEIVAAGKWPVALAEIPAEHKKDEVKMEKQETKTEEKTNDNANPAGSEVKSDAKPALPDKPADEKQAEKPAETSDYERGKAEGRAEGEIEHAKQISKRDELVKQHQSAKDQAESRIKEIEKQSAEALKRREGELMAKINDLTKCLKDVQDQNHKFLAGGMSFTPAAPESWEEAMKLCNGDYVKCVGLYPKLRDEYNERMKRK